jgi:hypothetical protein
VVRYRARVNLNGGWQGSKANKSRLDSDFQINTIFDGRKILQQEFKMNDSKNGVVLTAEEAIRPYLRDKTSTADDHFRAGVFVSSKGSHIIVWERTSIPTKERPDAVTTYSFGHIEGNEVKVHPGSFFALALALREADVIPRKGAVDYPAVFQQQYIGSKWQGPGIQNVFQPDVR